MAYPSDVALDGVQAQREGPLTGLRGPVVEEGLAAEGLAWLKKNLEAGSDARVYDLYLLYNNDYNRDYKTNICM